MRQAESATSGKQDADEGDDKALVHTSMNVPTEKQGSPDVRLAATVMLVRARAGGSTEVYLLRRSGKSAFAPDAYVFPGGTVDAHDTVEARANERSHLRTSQLQAGFS